MKMQTPISKERNIELIFGKTGTGKTHLAKKLLTNYDRQFIIDPKLEYNEGSVFYSFLGVYNYVAQYNLFQNDLSFTIITRFKTDIENDYLFKLIELTENCVLLCDEIEKFIDRSNTSSHFNELVNYGRHHNVSIIGIARRPAELSTTLKSQVNTIYSFQQTLYSDLQYMSKLGFSDLSELPFFRENPNLPPTSYYEMVSY